jgi:hypothetical protein
MSSTFSSNASQRFEEIEMLLRQENHTDSKNAWYIGSMIPDPDDDTTEQVSPYKIFTSAVDFWLPFANTKLKTIYDTQFGVPTVTAAANIPVWPALHDSCALSFLRCMTPPSVLQVSHFAPVTFTPKRL